MSLGVILTILLGFGATDPIRTHNRTSGMNVGGGVGEKAERPSNVDDIPARYRLQFGELHVDLTDVDFPDQTTQVEATVGIGELEVIVPDGVGLSISAAVGAGEINLLGETTSGADLDENFQSSDFDLSDRRLDLKLGAGIGEVRVRRGT